MRGTRIALSAALVVASTTLVGVAHADDAVRIVIGGPKKDPIAARLEKELVALGFEPVFGLDDCSPASVVKAVHDASASAALCSDGATVVVWTDDGKELKLRDVVSPQEKGPHARDQVAMRAAEVARANIAFREPEPEPIKPAPAAPSVAASGEWDELEGIEKEPPAKPEPRTAATFSLSGGASYLASTVASTSALSAQLAIGVSKSFSLTARVEAALTGTPTTPISSDAAPDSSHVRIAPGIAGVGVEMPFARLSTRIVPRLGAGLGLAWVHAEKTPGFVSDPSGAGILVSNTLASTDTIAVMAGWLTGGLSIRAAGPLRVVADGLIGSTAGRLVIRNQGTINSRWGAPLAALALRAEVSFQ